jgi:XapX domain-containing protein
LFIAAVQPHCSPLPSPELIMNYLISLAIGVAVGVLYGALDFRSPAPPLVALVGLLGMQAGEYLWPMGRDLIASWVS